LETREKTRRFIKKEMSRPHGKEIIEIEEKIMELIKRMDHLLLERYEIEKRKEEKEKQNHQQY
jgi:hypothetical protein